MQSWSELAGGEFDFNLVRSELGLPTLGPLDPAELPVERLSLVRLARLDVAKLNDDELRRLYQHALAFQIPTALPKLARAVVDRPSLAASEECRTACRVLAQTERDPQQAVHYIDRARKAEQAAGRSCASLDFQELDLRIRSGQGEAANRLLAHLQQQHIREPGVAEALYRILVQIGAISPDGRPTAPSREEPSLIVPGGGEAEPGKIWTPDSETPGGQRGKLWTPD
jgi:hypothetical protein